MKKTTTIFPLLLAGFFALISVASYAAIDMQAHVASDEGLAAYTAYRAKQSAYYTGNYSYTALVAKSGNELFGALNALMGNTSRIGSTSFTYNTLKDAYVNVDRDLNSSGKIIGYYDGCVLNGTWGSGWNREHTWPQSKGAKSGIPMGHDMQSVRPTSTSVNSDRGNDANDELNKYYDPNDVKINNSNYKAINLGTYRGDAARVILYDYIVYGEAGGYKNSLYNGNAQLLQKLGTSGVFESLAVLLKWHMQDPPSLTEMVRNDGAQNYQGNRNPFIDFPELAIEVLRVNSGVTAYNVTHSGVDMQPAYAHTTPAGFICYLTKADGTHPEESELQVTGGTYQYNASLGRLTVSKATGAVNISVSDGSTALEDIDAEPDTNAQVVIYNAVGAQVARTTQGALNSVMQTLPHGLYILRTPRTTTKVLW